MGVTDGLWEPLPWKGGHPSDHGRLSGDTEPCDENVGGGLIESTDGGLELMICEEKDFGADGKALGNSWV
jgi:hypothetical protein